MEGKILCLFIPNKFTRKEKSMELTEVSQVLLKPGVLHFLLKLAQ